MKKLELKLKNLRRSAVIDHSYGDAHQKKLFHSRAAGFLRELAIVVEEKLWSVRSNKAGVACAGEITLHGDTVYVQVFQDFAPSLCHSAYPAGIMVRSVKHNKDYTGGCNQFISLSKPLEDIVSLVRTTMYNECLKRTEANT